MSSLSVMILAGGRSRRMGTDKALLPLPNGQLLLKKIVQIGQALSSDVVVVTPWPARYESLLPSTVVLINETPHHNGPLGGFAQGWHFILSDWCLLLACDLPQLESAPLGEWWDWIQHRAPQVEAKQQFGEKTQVEANNLNVNGLGTAIASLSYRDHAYRGISRSPQLSAPQSSALKNKKQWEPLCGFYHRSCLLSLHRHLNAASDGNDSHRLSFQSWLAPLNVMAYDALPKSVLFNCNTPEDWAQLES